MCSSSAQSSQTRSDGTDIHQLSPEINNIQKAFFKYKMAVYQYAKSVCGIDSYIQKLFRHMQVQEYIEGKVDELYKTVTLHVDFLNCELLSLILEECNRINGDVETKERTIVDTVKAEYDEAFSKFAQLKAASVVDGLGELHAPFQDGVYSSLKIKIEESFGTFTIDLIFHFRKTIRDVFDIPREVLLQVSKLNEEGSIEITFKVIGIIADKAFEIDPGKRKKLAEENISMVEYAGKMCYHLTADQVNLHLIRPLCFKFH